jgi:putative two-component system hydrogenase maturation factor HypX/HoxX
VYRTEELATMSRDIFDDRLGFAAARHAFVMKRPAGTSSSSGRRAESQRIVA